MLTSSQSYSGGVLNANAMRSDVVLDVPTLRAKAGKLGNAVVYKPIRGGLHDIFLSPERVRQKAFESMEKWLK